MIYVLVLVYALVRWGSGREIVIGLTVVLVAAVIGTVADYTGYTLVILPSLSTMASAVWLLVKGFGPASHPSSSAREETTARGQLLPPTAHPKPASTASPTSVTIWS